jgi:F-box-like
MRCMLNIMAALAQWIRTLHVRLVYSPHSADVIISHINVGTRAELSATLELEMPRTAMNFSSEILLEIFLFAAWSNNGIGQQNSEIHRLTLVSTHWQQVALSLPRLWAAFSIQQPCTVSVARQAENASLWFSRSKKHMLSLHAAIASETHNLIPLLRLLAQHQARWKALDISLFSGPGELLAEQQDPMLILLCRPLPVAWREMAFSQIALHIGSGGFLLPPLCPYLTWRSPSSFVPFC